MNDPLCSIIIPTYNHGNLIERSVSSALAQTYSNKEVIVVDDGSTDDTKERLKKLLPEITYHIKENGGLGAARNTGIQLSKGKYLQFLDADDYIAPEKLERQVSFLEDNPEIAVVYSDCSCNDPTGREIDNVSYPLGDDEDPLGVLMARTLFGVHAGLTRRDAVIAVGMFDSDRLAQEDWDLWLKLALNGYKFRYLPGELAHYDQGGSSMIVNSRLMYQRASHLLKKYLNDPTFLKLEKSLINRFILEQNVRLATRAFNNGWWRRSRKHFLRAIVANPRMIDRKHWNRIALSILRQGYDLLRGRPRAEPPELDA